eukprot:TRINITY_DN23452_c0_g1_i1.p1 TRINITY_DN23452_c0_g1~~TRINITY_DN23452_c0_g1_i1.p1  ORF type:complete len:186 (-),score=26.48 TRINITY_DN23452_c0_g1_i1:11-568(-)
MSPLLHAVALHNVSKLDELKAREKAALIPQKIYEYLPRFPAETIKLIVSYSETDGGAFGLVELLISSNARVNTKNKFNLNALHFAAIKGQSAVAGLLLQYKADVNALSGLKQQQLQTTPLMEAVNSGSEAVVRVLLEAKAEITPTPKHGISILETAELLGHFAIREIGRAVQQECRDRSRMPSSA